MRIPHINLPINIFDGFYIFALIACCSLCNIGDVTFNGVNIIMSMKPVTHWYIFKKGEYLS